MRLITGSVDMKTTQSIPILLEHTPKVAEESGVMCCCILQPRECLKLHHLIGQESTSPNASNLSVSPPPMSNPVELLAERDASYFQGPTERVRTSPHPSLRPPFSLPVNVYKTTNHVQSRCSGSASTDDPALTDHWFILSSSHSFIQSVISTR